MARRNHELCVITSTSQILCSFLCKLHSEKIFLVRGYRQNDPLHICLDKMSWNEKFDLSAFSRNIVEYHARKTAVH